MAQYYPTQENVLNIKVQYYNELDIQGFSQMLKDPSFCYKFYWLEAIVNLISEGITETTFDAIIDEMIANAWYSVREFYIHLSGLQADGMVRDGLERAILQLTELSTLPANASKIEIKNAIGEYNSELKRFKEQLTNMVPYRALAGFFARSKEKAEWNSIRRMTTYIKEINDNITPLPYVLGESSKLKKYYSDVSDAHICMVSEGLVEAVELEEKRAIYPRIILSSKVVEKIHDEASDLYQVAQLLIQCQDDYWCINPFFLCPDFAPLIQNINTEIKKFAEELHICKKYMWLGELMNYFCIWSGLESQKEYYQKNKISVEEKELLPCPILDNEEITQKFIYLKRMMFRYKLDLSVFTRTFEENVKYYFNE
ncbi:hypothetical protein [Blautia obeum]|uniref:Uncharacterized protein n=1 Tax=Blautia obeum TaxID=40520 RepID=A0A174LZ05_9FIRM|nr:hypothetical protein [Blautia obeum]CUP26729.1 Uncharacterised protein [Blautia obeum]